MLRHILERGLASAVSHILLQTRLDSLFEQVRRVGAMSDQQLEQLRRDTQSRLAEVEREGRESLELLQRLVGDLVGRLLGRGGGLP